MPFIRMGNDYPNVLLGGWEVTEEEMFFLTRLKMYEHEWSRLEKIAHPKKRLEWLSSRLIIKELLQISHKDRVESLNEESGRPYLSNRSHFISYTHSDRYSAAIACLDREVGIDIEYLKRKRNTETRTLFMNDKELSWYTSNQGMEAFILIWSAKETLYKIVSQRGISFREHISLDIQNVMVNQNGMLEGTVKKDDQLYHYLVHYAICPDFVLTYTVDSMPGFQSGAGAAAPVGFSTRDR